MASTDNRTGTTFSASMNDGMGRCLALSLSRDGRQMRSSLKQCQTRSRTVALTRLGLNETKRQTRFPGQTQAGFEFLG